MSAGTEVGLKVLLALYDGDGLGLGWSDSQVHVQPQSGGSHGTVGQTSPGLSSPHPALGLLLLLLQVKIEGEDGHDEVVESDQLGGSWL